MKVLLLALITKELLPGSVTKTLANFLCVQ